MSNFPIFFFLALLVIAFLLGRWAWEAARHRRRIGSLRVRIHVNGIRGKSTVTRLVAGVLREAGYRTVAKTTGTLAAVIHSDGRETPIERRGAATILEQVEVLEREVPPDTDALVVECMALEPDYQAVSEDKMICSTLGILTNVREDHQDVMGETLPEIARALLNTCPQRGVLVTGEQDPALLEIIRRTAERRGSRLLVADPSTVDDADLNDFEYVSFKDNLAIGFAVASLLGIPRDLALAGMRKADPDPGVLRFVQLQIGAKRVTWANLFAANDTQSVMEAMRLVLEHRTPDSTTVAILNNRRDRELRCMQFADIATQNLEFDRIATFGAYESAVRERLLSNGYPAAQIIELGEASNPSLAEILDQLVHRMPTRHVLLVGLANIHTKQAELLLEHFVQLLDASKPELVASAAAALEARA